MEVLRRGNPNVVQTVHMKSDGGGDEKFGEIWLVVHVQRKSMLMSLTFWLTWDDFSDCFFYSILKSSRSLFQDNNSSTCFDIIICSFSITAVFVRNISTGMSRCMQCALFLDGILVYLLL